MAHRRKKIRTELKRILLGKTDAKDRVFINQSSKQWQGDLPAIFIYPQSELSEKYAEAPRELRRLLDVRFEIVATGPEEPVEEGKIGINDILDDLAEQLECELSRDDTWGHSVDDMILTNTEFEFEDEGSSPIASVKLTYTATYHQLVPDTIDKQAGIEDFRQANADWHVGHHDEEPDLNNTEADDEVEIPTT